MPKSNNANLADLTKKIYDNDVAGIKTILEANKGKNAFDINDFAEVHGNWRTPFEAAVTRDAPNAEICRLLLDAGANMIEYTSNNGYTLPLLCTKQDTGALKIFLHHPKTRPFFLRKSEDGNTVFHKVLAGENNEKAFKLLMEDEECRKLLYTPNKAGDLPLHAAAQKGRTDCIPTILASAEGKETLHARNEKGITPYMLAFLSENPNTSAMLRAEGATFGTEDIQAVETHDDLKAVKEATHNREHSKADISKELKKLRTFLAVSSNEPDVKAHLHTGSQSTVHKLLQEVQTLRDQLAVLQREKPVIGGHTASIGAAGTSAGRKPQ